MSDRITLVSGASSNHFRCLVNLIRSVAISRPDVERFIVYDLGLSAEERLQLMRLPVEYRRFEFESYPSSEWRSESSGSDTVERKFEGHILGSFSPIDRDDGRSCVR